MTTLSVGVGVGVGSTTWTVSSATGKRQASARVKVAADAAMSEILFDTGERDDLTSLGVPVDLALAPRTRYFWQVAVCDDTGDSAVSDVQWFETARDVSDPGGPWQAQWITPDADKSVQSVVFNTIHVDRPVARARAYVLGLGEYELMLNGEKQGNECLLPGLHAYDQWLQYQTFELSLKDGDNLLEIMLGDGWYKGNFGLNIKYENYGDRLAARLSAAAEHDPRRCAGGRSSACLTDRSCIS